LFRDFRTRGLAMVSVSLREPADTVREWGEDYDVEFPLWLDPGGETLAAFGVRGHPSTVLIDREGRIVARVPGERNWNSPEARRLVEWLLTESAR
jgi:peroxiredoxin